MTQFKVGDRFTIAGVYPLFRNPARRWWQLWKPRWITSAELKQFTIAVVAKAKERP